MSVHEEVCSYILLIVVLSFDKYLSSSCMLWYVDTSMFCLFQKKICNDHILSDLVGNICYKYMLPGRVHGKSESNFRRIGDLFMVYYNL